MSSHLLTQFNFKTTSPSQTIDYIMRSTLSIIVSHITVVYRRPCGSSTENNISISDICTLIGMSKMLITV